MPDTQERADYDADVIIVGAGPIGLTTAAALRHHGVDCRILEQRTEEKPYSRANNVWARPQELLDSIGIRDALAENAYRIRQVNTLLNGQPTDPVKVDHVESPYPQVLYSGQDVIEKTLSKAADDRGRPVERGRKVLGIEQDGEGVTVTVVPASDEDGDEQGPAERLRCRYLIGADGTEGTVRKALDLDFEPKKLKNRMNRQVDARLHWRRSMEPDQLWFYYYKDGFCGILPVWGGYHRLFFLADDAGVPDRDPTLDEMQAIAREVTGDDSLTLSDPIWFSHSRFQHGVATSYKKDRVLLVGDAGHYTLPIGGQGMNAGFQDAVSVAWRLAMTLEGHAASVVLDSYDDERGGEHIRLDDQQTRGFKNVVYRGPLTDLALGVAAKALPDIGSRIQGTDDLQQLSVSYPKSPLNEDHLSHGQLLHAHVPQAGERAPNAEVTNEAIGTTNLFAHIYNPDGRSWGWSLLAFDGRQGDAGTRLLAAVTEVAAWDWVRPRLVLAALAPAVEGGFATVLSDLDTHAHSAYGIGEVPALVLVRPDGVIAFRGEADSPERLKAYCEKVFGPAPVATEDRGAPKAAGSRE
jgi:2-polyprenyl-6-methoxyphenol hydroxylase-like FAD-dependent oxidoreductase